MSCERAIIAECRRVEKENFQARYIITEKILRQW